MSLVPVVRYLEHFYQSFAHGDDDGALFRRFSTLLKVHLSSRALRLSMRTYTVEYLVCPEPLRITAHALHSSFYLRPDIRSYQR